ncbi:hypothetical protein AVEN_153657-1 [Araneus ventricosus]|uniref:Uncharacterized protein n=1 Tax=Araneus ventricosus TaxID=182803 RepID=A0A4Y2BNU2_ARAVE|nr:hypothetical protein AVEN_153657-1 [Araneus ventricosus]
MLGLVKDPENALTVKDHIMLNRIYARLTLKRKKILELKCWNQITTSEAQRVFHLQNMKYSEAVKSSPASVELQDTVNLKFEALLQSLNEKFECLLQSVNEKFEKQTAIFVEMLHKTIESIMQNMYKFIVRSLETNILPTRKKNYPRIWILVEAFLCNGMQVERPVKMGSILVPPVGLGDVTFLFVNVRKK